ncbi:SnoaL-like domain-containing protein, partial [Chaetomium strumarium]
MTDMYYPQHLPSLSEREAVADALYRAAIGCDHNDAELFNSAWAGEDVSFEFHEDNDKRVMSCLSAIRKNILEIVGPMDTTHNTSMVRVNLEDGADTATLTATSTAQHCPPGMGRDPTGPKYTTGGEYSVDLIRDESGIWRIKKL